MRKLLAALAVSLFTVLPAQAQGLTVASGDSIQTILAARKGKPVTVRLSSDQELTGVVREVSAKLLVLGSLAGREFFDAAIPLEKIEAVSAADGPHEILAAELAELAARVG